MAKQIPGAWQGQEVTVYYGPEERRQTGTLEGVSKRGIVLRADPGSEKERVYWYPVTSVIRLMQGKPRGGAAVTLKPPGF
jgi:hypothetical protein